MQNNIRRIFEILHKIIKQKQISEILCSKCKDYQRNLHSIQIYAQFLIEIHINKPKYTI